MRAPEALYEVWIEETALVNRFARKVWEHKILDKTGVPNPVLEGNAVSKLVSSLDDG